MRRAERRTWKPLSVESVRVAASTVVVSGLVALLATSVPVTVAVVAGLNIEGQRGILRQIDVAGARTITVLSSAGEAAIPASAVERIGNLEGVAWVVGLGPVFDARLRQPVGEPTPVRTFLGVRAPVVFGRAAGLQSASIQGASAPTAAYVSGESARRIGLEGAFGLLEPGALPVLGWFRASEPLAALESFVLAPITDEGRWLERIVVAVEDVGWVDQTTGNIPALLGAGARQSTTIERSPILLRARAAIRDEMVQRDRLLVLALLALATAVGCIVVFAGALASRRDFGRRRALGATQAQLTALVVLSTLWPAMLGSTVGTILGWASLSLRLGSLAEPWFPMAVGILTMGALTAASALPAGYAATRDPLRVLRVP